MLWDTTHRAWQGRWSLRGAVIFWMKGLTSDRSFNRCFEVCHNVEQLLLIFDESVNNNNIFRALLSLFLFIYPSGCLQFSNGMEFWWRDFNFKGRRHILGRRQLVVPWLCEEVFVILSASHQKFLLFSSMVCIDNCKGPRWLFGSSLSVFAYFSGLVFKKGSSGRADTQAARVKLVVMIKCVFLDCALFCLKQIKEFEDWFMMHVGVLLYLPSEFLAEIDKLYVFHIVWGTWCECDKSIVAFHRLDALYLLVIVGPCIISWMDDLPTSRQYGSNQSQLSPRRDSLAKSFLK